MTERGRGSTVVWSAFYIFWQAYKKAQVQYVVCTTALITRFMEQGALGASERERNFKLFSCIYYPLYNNRNWFIIDNIFPLPTFLFSVHRRNLPFLKASRFFSICFCLALSGAAATTLASSSLIWSFKWASWSARLWTMENIGLLSA